MTEEELIEVKPENMGFPRNDYPGAFPSRVEDRIKRLVGSPCLHLFSGTSKIGDVRVDLERPEATCNQDVFDFIARNTAQWKWVIADPPYQIVRANYKLKKYGARKSVGGNIAYQHIIDEFLQYHAENALWFDFVTPCPKGMYREKVWLYLPGGFSWFKPRFLTWLKRKGEHLT